MIMGFPFSNKSLRNESPNPIKLLRKVAKWQGVCRATGWLSAPRPRLRPAYQRTVPGSRVDAWLEPSRTLSPQSRQDRSELSLQAQSCDVRFRWSVIQEQCCMTLTSSKSCRLWSSKAIRSPLQFNRVLRAGLGYLLRLDDPDDLPSLCGSVRHCI